LSLGFCCNQIGQTFGNGQIHLAIGKSPSGKLSGFRYPASGDFSKLRQEPFDDRLAAMRMKFGAILTGKAVRPREKEHQTVIDRVTITGTEQLIGCIARRG